MTDKLETLEGFTVGQVITCGSGYCIEKDKNLSSSNWRDIFVKPGDEVTILGFEQMALIEGQTHTSVTSSKPNAAVVRLHRPREYSDFPSEVCSGTVFLLSLKFLHKWVARDALVKKYVEENER